MIRRLLLNEAAKELGVSPHYLRVEAKAGRLPHLRVGNRFLFPIEQVEEFLKQKALENVKNETSDNDSYGTLRKVT
jgi:excisionase family DNA binding protein